MRVKAEATVSEIQKAMGGVDKTIDRRLSDDRKAAMADAFGGMKSPEAKPVRGRKLSM